MKTYPLLTSAASPEAIILANGDYPVHPLPLALLEKSTYVVCCDGAINGFARTGLSPAAIVGDGDSLSAENKIRFADLLHPMADQETNDQTKALHFCLQHGKTDLLILGATGKREDHTLGNISLLADYMKRATISMVTDYGMFTPVCGDSCFETVPGQQISLFSLEPKEVSVTGLRYPITNRILTSWWQGTLNEAQGEHFYLYTAGSVIVFREHIPLP